VVKERLRELLDDGQHVLQEEVGAQQAHTAVDVKPHAARRHDRIGVCHVKGRHVADCKAVARVHVGHGHGLLDNARQRRNVGDLLHGGQKAAHALAGREVLQLLKQQLFQLGVHVKGAGHDHVGHKALVDREVYGRILLDEGALLLVRANYRGGAHGALKVRVKRKSRRQSGQGDGDGRHFSLKVDGSRMYASASCLGSVDKSSGRSSRFAGMSDSYVVSAEKRAFYKMHGWVVLEDVVPAPELARISDVLTRILSGDIDSGKGRSDLGGHAERKNKATENIIQLSWPTDMTSLLDENLLISRGRSISEQLYGDNSGTWSLDMNQFLVKEPFSLTDTPWHQDQSYYIALEDPRACNIWLALQDVSVDMGCLWFEDSPLDAPCALKPHFPAGTGGGALQFDRPSGGPPFTPAPLKAGSVTVHSHLTPHYAQGNATAASRRGYVVQTRPTHSVREGRMRGFDHGRTAGNTAEERLSRAARVQK
jgi:phytanoyl-CoA hydroxylase